MWSEEPFALHHLLLQHPHADAGKLFAVKGSSLPPVGSISKEASEIYRAVGKPVSHFG